MPQIYPAFAGISAQQATAGTRTSSATDSADETAAAALAGPAASAPDIISVSSTRLHGTMNDSRSGANTFSPAVATTESRTLSTDLLTPARCTAPMAPQNASDALKAPRIRGEQLPCQRTRVRMEDRVL